MYHLNVFSLSTLFASEIYLLMAVYILSRNPRAAANRLFFPVALTMAIWGLGEGMQRAATEPDTALFWATYVVGVGSALHSAFLMHFWLTFSGQIVGFKKRVPIFILYIPSLCFLAIRTFSPHLLITGVTREYWGFTTGGTRLYSLYMLYLVSYTAAMVYLALRLSFKIRGDLGRQARNIGLGVLFSLLVGIATQAARPLLAMEFPESTVISTLVFISFIAYAVSKYGLLIITPAMAADKIVETQADHIVVVDRQMRVSLANESVLALLGKRREELYGTHVDHLPIELGELFRDLEQKRLVNNWEAVILDKDKRRVPVSINASVMKDELGSTIGYVLAMRDISHMNEIMANLSRSNLELEQFARIASHDLKEPLRKVAAFGERIKARSGDSMDAKSRDYLERMQTRRPA